MKLQAPGSHQHPRDFWGSFETLLSERLPEQSLVLIDRQVLRLHPRVGKALKKAKPLEVMALKAGEQLKALTVLDQVLKKAYPLTRQGTIVVVGGGTLGDLATVAAHLIKRGVNIIQVPTTLLAAVDSSVGGKGALHLKVGSQSLKNALGVFHYPAESWICPELFETLSESQLREGQIEAWKMIVCLSPLRWKRYLQHAPSLTELIKAARKIKSEVCRQDPYEQTHLRSVLNFGHSFGHVWESVTGYRTSHGEAVGLGILCALDVGRRLGVTSPHLASQVEQVFTSSIRGPSREAMASVLKGVTASRISSLLLADKKAAKVGELRMVLLKEVGQWALATVDPKVWRDLLPDWKKARRT